MKFDREELLQKLDVAKLAIDSRDFIPILSHFCFHGKYVIAYNDFIGIQVECKTNFALALQANTLLRLLSSVGHAEVEVGESKEAVFFKAGPARTGVRARLPFMAEEDFFFKWPAEKRLNSTELTEAAAEHFVNGLQLCLSSIGDQMPSQMGVTLNQAGKKLFMYSTNNKAISKYTMAAIGVPGLDNIILPTVFCAAVLKGAQTYGQESMTLAVAKDFVVVRFGKECALYGKLVNNKDPLNFEDVIATHIAKDYDKKKQSVPKNFYETFERAQLILTNDLNKVANIHLSQNTLSVEAKSALGKVKSSAVFKKEWKETRLVLDVELACKAAEHCTEVYFGKDVVVFSQGPYMHLLSTYRGGE